MSRVTARGRYRFWFRLDALVTGVNAIAYFALSGVLPSVLGGTGPLYRSVGLILGIVTVGLTVVATAPRRPSVLSGALVVTNLLWAVASIIVAVADPLGLNPWGRGWALVQGLVVLCFAIFQARSLTRNSSFTDDR